MPGESIRYLCKNITGHCWPVLAYCKNIINYAVQKSYMGMQYYTMMIGDPRTYGASSSVKF
jgi:hypothetical protein